MKSFLKPVILMTLLGLTVNAVCQVDVDVKDKVENQTNNKLNQKTDQSIGKGLNSIENGIKGVFKKKGSKDKTQTQESQKQESVNNPESKKQEAPVGLESYSKFDFVPGEKVIYYEDFSQDAVGDFPALWNTNGSAEVVTTNLFPGHWVKFNTEQAIWTDNLLTLPDNYTIEFDIIPAANAENNMAGYHVRLMQCINTKAFDYGSAPGKGGFHFQIEYFGRPSFSTWFLKGGCEELALRGTKEEEIYKEVLNHQYHIAIWVQKSRIRLYQNQNKLFDLPKALPVECLKVDRLRFEDGAAMISNIRIAVGAPDMRNKLLTEGKLVSYGIYFDVNKDVVKPESFGTLKGIAAVMSENPGLRIKIVGHTDNDGVAAANLDLSKRRGAAVKNELVKTFSIDASRIESDGMGATKPVAPNDSPANKALNRRVEFIKL
ncbi:MAG: OmpA family protein [Bacteroidota bacterium]|nr:OmpA family protein [Bacteroidota bacterium]MDP4275227.1 OmpA family protein [Bacteroidota bacterium]